MNRYLVIMSFFVLSPILSLAATPAPIEVFGRVEVRGDEKSASCRVCIGCEVRSGGIERPFKCKPEEYFDGSKMQLRVRVKRVGGECGIEVVQAMKILSPAERLPDYPNQKELESLFRCP